MECLCSPKGFVLEDSKEKRTDMGQDMVIREDERC